ncbi:MAG: hypothetical protein ACK5Z5_00440 [Neisseriaceae bacterium]
MNLPTKTIIHKYANNRTIENNDLDQEHRNTLKEVEEITGVPAPDPEKQPDPWTKKPHMNIYYDETEDN